MNTKIAKKILLVDDDEDLRSLLKMFLNIGGYEVFEAIHGEDAKEQLKIITPDLITLDMMMPVLDGMGFLRWLRQEAKLDIPVISLTGRSRHDTQPIALELGATEVIFKPCYPEELVEAINKILS